MYTFCCSVLSMYITRESAEKFIIYSLVFFLALNLYNIWPRNKYARNINSKFAFCGFIYKIINHINLTLISFQLNNYYILIWKIFKIFHLKILFKWLIICFNFIIYRVYVEIYLKNIFLTYIKITYLIKIK